MQAASEANKLAKRDAPFLSLETDPAAEPLKSYRGKHKKVLTKAQALYILENVKKLKKDDNGMLHGKNQTPLKNTGSNAVCCLAWLVEVTFRGFAGWVLVAKFNTLLTMAAGIYALGTALVIVGMHFYKAHN